MSTGCLRCNCDIMWFSSCARVVWGYSCKVVFQVSGFCGVAGYRSKRSDSDCCNASRG